MGQGAFGGALDGRPVGHRIGKRHAELDDVGAARHQRPHQRQGLVGMRVTRGNERDQGLAALCGQRGKDGLNS